MIHATKRKHVFTDTDAVAPALTDASSTSSRSPRMPTFPVDDETSDDGSPYQPLRHGSSNASPPVPKTRSRSRSPSIELVESFQRRKISHVEPEAIKTTYQDAFTAALDLSDFDSDSRDPSLPFRGTRQEEVAVPVGHDDAFPESFWDHYDDFENSSTAPSGAIEDAAGIPPQSDSSGLQQALDEPDSPNFSPLEGVSIYAFESAASNLISDPEQEQHSQSQQGDTQGSGYSAWNHHHESQLYEIEQSLGELASAYSSYDDAATDEQLDSLEARMQHMLDQDEHEEAGFEHKQWGDSMVADLGWDGNA